MTYKTLQLEHRQAVVTIWLNRPQVRNALDEHLIAEVTDAVTQLQRDDEVRVIVLGGRGTSFCAGGDLNWMKRMAEYSGEQNLQDAQKLALMLRTIYVSEKPIVARVHGPAYAGGMGLASACDVIVAEPQAEFCLSEVRIGLVPATISPYVIKALGTQAARRFMITGERISAAEAHRLGFVHELANTGEIDSSVSRICTALVAGGPKAVAKTKSLIAEVDSKEVTTEVIEMTARCIADVRASAEGREGVSAFIEKRKSRWVAA